MANLQRDHQDKVQVENREEELSEVRGTSSDEEQVVDWSEAKISEFQERKAKLC